MAEFSIVINATLSAKNLDSATKKTQVIKDRIRSSVSGTPEVRIKGHDSSSLKETTDDGEEEESRTGSRKSRSNRSGAR